jgi:hypothetical protein
MMTLLERKVVDFFNISTVGIFICWRDLKKDSWNRSVKDAKRNLLDHWTSIALTPSYLYTQFSLIGFTVSARARASYLDDIQSFRSMPKIWLGHESSVEEDTTTCDQIKWRPLNPDSWDSGPMSILMTRLREFEVIDDCIKAIKENFSDASKKHSLEVFDMKSFLEDESRLNESYCDGFVFFKLQLETIDKVGFIQVRDSILFF